MDVQRIKNAGALVIIMTNCSEQCMWYEMSMNVCGTTSYNPYNTDCMVEESSGGEGSIDRAACSMFGIGSDIGGGFRMPPPLWHLQLQAFAKYFTPDGIANELPSTSGDAKACLARGPMCRSSIYFSLILDVMTSNAIESKSLTSKIIAVDVTFFTLPDDNNRSWYCNPVEHALITTQSEVVIHYGVN